MPSSWIRDNAVVLATIGALALMILFSTLVFKPLFAGPEVVFVEEPLAKNTNHQLVPGETYRYSFDFNMTEINVTYAVLPGLGCTRIRMLEKLNDSETCIDFWGNDEAGFNSTLQNPAFMLFKPWMLALEENWRWKSSMYLSYGGAPSHISDTAYRVIRKEEYGNRTAFVVEIRTDGDYAEYQWIDAEKRILLKAVGKGYEVKLAD